MTNGSMNKLIESDLPINPSQKISHEKRLIAIDIAQHFALNQEEALKYLQHEIVYNVSTGSCRARVEMSGCGGAGTRSSRS